MTQLPSTRTWPFTLSGRIIDVTLGFISWPEIIVAITERGRDQVLEARFRADGSLHKVTFSADAGEITAAELRRPVMTTISLAEALAREYARRILAGEPEPDLGTGDLAGALRCLLYRKPGSRRRGADLEHVAAAYRRACQVGHHAPLQAVAEETGYSWSHVSHLIAQARKPRDGRPPLLGPALAGKAGESEAA